MSKAKEKKEKKDWMQMADDHADQREGSLLTAIEEVEKARYTHPDLGGLNDSTETVLCYLAGALAEIRRMEQHLNWLMQKRAKEEGK